MPLSTSIRPPRRRAIAVALAGALCLTATAWPNAASAKGIDTVLTTTASGINILETPDTRQTCTAPQVIPAFASLGDTRDYVLAPGGSFEGKDLAGWQVKNATSAKGGSPLALPDSGQGHVDNERSLSIPAGGSAISPAMCVDLHYPTLRMMAKQLTGQGELKVEVIYPDSADPSFQLAGSVATDGQGWQASPDVPVFPERGGAAPGMRRVALRFTSVAASDGSTGDWRIDDLYVDPKRL